MRVRVCTLCCFSHVQLFVTLWTVVHEAPLSVGFFSQDYWNGLPWSPSGDFPDTGIEPMSSVAHALQAGSLPLNHHCGLWLLKFITFE